MTKRRANDAYFTPEPVVRACLATLPPEAFWLDVLEPSAGEGVFEGPVMELSAGGRAVIMADVSPAGPGMFAGDFLEPAFREFLGDISSVGYSSVVGNPPYKRAEAFVRHSIEMVQTGGYVAFLLRLAFLESAKRAPLFAEHPPKAVHVLVNRPSFTGNGTDSAAYAFVIWQRGFTGKTELGWLDWKRAA